MFFIEKRMYFEVFFSVKPNVKQATKMCAVGERYTGDCHAYYKVVIYGILETVLWANIIKTWYFTRIWNTSGFKVSNWYPVQPCYKERDGTKTFAL